jgi:hypothetical protein
MTHDVQAIREDLAFMRALAQEGRRAPLLIGYGLFTAGLVYGAATIFAWAVEARVLAVPYWWEGAIYVLATVVYAPYMRWWRRSRAGDRPGATALTNRAVKAAMQGLSYAILSLMFGSMALAYSLHTTAVFAMFPSVVLAVYGAAWMVAAAMSEVRWLRLVAVGCFLAAVVMGFTTAHAWGYLVFTAALLVVTSLPGWLLMRSEPSTTV